MPQGKPIPTRFDKSTMDMIETLHGRTGLSKSDLIRRALAHTLRHIISTGDTSVLYDNPALEESRSTATHPQQPVKYTPKPRVPKSDAQLLAERQQQLADLEAEHAADLAARKKRR